MYFPIIILSLAAGLIYIYLKHPYFFRAIRLTYFKGRTTASIYDLEDFPHKVIERGEVETWKKGKRYNTYIPSHSFVRYLKKMGTGALLVAKNGELIHEQYFLKHKQETVSNSFSVAKTIAVLLTGKAIEEGFLKGPDQKVSEIFPQYSYEPAGELTIHDLIRMSSGMDWKENYYLPFNITTAAYYGDHLDLLTLNRRIKEKPGQEFHYKSGNTQLLGLVLDKVLPVSMAEYLSAKFWKPMGMEHTAYWSIDRSSKIEKAYCCIHASARDFLKFGQLFLQNGQWDDRQLIATDFLEMMRTPGFPESPQYGAGLWLAWNYHVPFYLLRGHLGQHIYVIPSEDMVIARLGKKCKKEVASALNAEDVFYYVDKVREMLKRG